MTNQPETNQPTHTSRREFLRLSALGTGTVLALRSPLPAVRTPREAVRSRSD